MNNGHRQLRFGEDKDREEQVEAGKSLEEAVILTSFGLSESNTIKPLGMTGDGKG